jgi:hypothetical protein
MEQGFEHCYSCVSKLDCGLAATNTSLLRCNMLETGKSSALLYSELYDCMCGPDGVSGACSEQCTRTCIGTSTDSGSCQSCLWSAFSSAAQCASAYKACAADK